MKHLTFIFVFFFTLTTGCQHKKSESNPYIKNLKVSDLNDTTTFVLDEKNATVVPIAKPSSRIKASEFIEDFRYIPIETVDSSFIGQYIKIYIYENRIFIQDAESQRCCIFDMDGKYINKIGRQGNGPNEFVKLNSIAIDVFHNHLVAHDTFLDKLFYFTLDGDFLYTKTLPLLFYGDFCFIEPNLVAFSLNRSKEENPQLKDLNRYHIIYTDSALNVKGGVVRHKKYYVPTRNFSSNLKETTYTSTHLPNFYQFEGTELICKYQFSHAGHSNAFNPDKYFEMEDDKKNEYFYKTTRMLPPVFFTDRFLWFKNYTEKPSDEFYTYYDMVTNKTRSFAALGIEWDTELSFSSVLNAYQDYLIGYVPAEELIAMKEQWEKANRKMDEKTAEIIDNLATDDNDVLVLFKLKPIQ